jgi:putative transposase
MADHGIPCSMSRSGNVWDNAAMGSFFPSLKTERTGRKVSRNPSEAKADVFDCIERATKLALLFQRHTGLFSEAM